MTSSQPSVDILYARETTDLVAARLPAITVVFAAVFSLAWLFEYLAHPERMMVYMTTFVVELSLCAIAVAVVQTQWGRGHAIAVASTTCVLIFGMITSYHVRLGGETEIMAFALMYIVTGMTVGLPLGFWGQLPIAVAAVAAYVSAVLFGARSVVSVPLITLGMASVGGLSVAGAAFLDRYRFSSFNRADELRQANAALAHANEAKNMFLANISHELRTPLNVVLGYTDLILEDNFGPLPESMRDPLERVVTNAQVLVRLIADLLDLSRIESGRLVMRIEAVDLCTLLREVSAAIPAELGDKPVRLVVEIPESMVAKADRDRLRQVLVNLLSNAAKFTPAGEIYVRAKRVSDMIEIEVVDSGVGITPEDLPHVFEPFRRAANAKEFSGLGIGLSISDRLVRAMGGQLTVESELDRGSRFRVSLLAAAP